MKPYFTVIIPLFNKEKFILNTIDSVLKQSFENFEVLIVEDCSTDTSLEVISTIKSEKVKLFSMIVIKDFRLHEILELKMLIVIMLLF
jgi:glycosyltransferase involved in cell wall biosynthesis